MCKAWRQSELVALFMKRVSGPAGRARYLCLYLYAASPASQPPSRVWGMTRRNPDEGLHDVSSSFWFFFRILSCLFIRLSLPRVLPLSVFYLYIFLFPLPLSFCDSSLRSDCVLFSSLSLLSDLLSSSLFFRFSHVTSIPPISFVFSLFSSPLFLSSALLPPPVRCSTAHLIAYRP